MRFDEAMSTGMRMERSFLPDRYGRDICIWGPYPGSVSEGSMIAAYFVELLLKIGVDLGSEKNIVVAKERCL